MYQKLRKLICKLFDLQEKSIDIQSNDDDNNDNTVIVFGNPIFDVKSGNEISYHINSMIITFDDMIQLSAQQHNSNKVQHIRISMQTAEDIGFINFNKLKQILECKQ